MPKPPPTKAALASQSWRLMFKFLMRTAPQRAQSLGRRGLTPNDSRALSALDPTEGRTMRSLAVEWACDASNATWIVDRLERQGLAERRANPADRRVTLVVLTKTGAATKRDLMEEFFVPPAGLLQLSTSELETLAVLLEKIP